MISAYDQIDIRLMCVTYIFLLANVLVESRVPNMALNRTLHHRASVVVLDEVFPSWFGQVIILREALLAEVLNGVIVSIC